MLFYMLARPSHQTRLCRQKLVCIITCSLEYEIGIKIGKILCCSSYLNLTWQTSLTGKVCTNCLVSLVVALPQCMSYPWHRQKVDSCRSKDRSVFWRADHQLCLQRVGLVTIHHCQQEAGPPLWKCTLNAREFETFPQSLDHNQNKLPSRCWWSLLQINNSNFTISTTAVKFRVKNNRKITRTSVSMFRKLILRNLGLVWRVVGYFTVVGRW
jgi:hypothetical protein